MIVIQCTHCKQQLSIDDAFAGGVCRCQHCGTIQTVPAAGSTALHTSNAPAAKSLYSNTGPRSGVTGAGLDDLAGIVASSGLHSGRLTKSDSPDRSPNLLPLWIGLGAVALILVVALIYWATRAPAPTPAAWSTNGTPGGTPGNTPLAVSGPNFKGVPLSGTAIIYAIDCGAATEKNFRAIKDEVFASIATLGSEKKFEVIFWTNKNDSTNWDYPDGTITYATLDNIVAAKSASSGAIASGSNDGKAALRAAVDQNPDVIVLVTGKGINLTDDWLDDMLKIRGNSRVKIDTFNASDDPSVAVLQKLASKTGGTYAEFRAPSAQN